MDRERMASLGRLARFGCLGVVVLGAVLGLPGAAAAAPTPPLWTSSRYMQPIDPDILYNEGLNLGEAVAAGNKPQDAVVVLDYGAQAQDASGAWGALSVIDGRFHPMSDLKAAVENFGVGYWVGTGADTTASLTVELGTNNSDIVNSSAGTVWGNAVDAINNYFSAHGFNSQVLAAGANDIEDGTSFCSSSTCPSRARDWADAFSSASSTAWYDDYGDCGGCGTAVTGSGLPGSWTRTDIWYVSWGAALAFPLPEIYRTDGTQAAQWEQLDEYGYNDISTSVSPYAGTAMYFDGSMTQHQSCATNGCDSTLDNTPDAGWTQLWNALNATSTPATGSHPAPSYVNQSLEWSTDIAHTTCTEPC